MAGHPVQKEVLEEASARHTERQMISILLLASSIAAAAVSFMPIDIVGGVPVSPAFKYPWLVSLESSYHFCGGSLLDATTIVTAAHCSDQDLAGLTVVAHRQNLDVAIEAEEGLVFSVTKITIHPNYDSKLMANDVAVWTVSLLSGDATKIPSGVVTLDDGSFSGDDQDLTISGWGTTTSSGSPSMILLETHVQVLGTAACAVEYPTVDATSICAAAPGKDTCQGDSGGPAFVTVGGKVTLVGITSYGNGCADPKFAGVYTRVSKVASWIKEQQVASQPQAK